jgi:hypothetical protein
MRNERPGRIAAFFVVWTLSGLCCALLLLRSKCEQLDRRQEQLARPIGPVLPYPRPY